MMGSPQSEEGRWDDEGPQHRVELTRGFWIADTPCTQAMWEAAMGNNPSHFTGSGKRPVEEVSWDDVQGFLETFNAHVPGFAARLPTEAEWEYACRAGTTTARYGELGEIAWYSANRGGETHEVGLLKPNPWGLYDMLGNVDEWCADAFRSYETQSSVNPFVAHGRGRVVRGGGWLGDARSVRAAFRHAGGPGRRPAVSIRAGMPANPVAKFAKLTRQSLLYFATPSSSRRPRTFAGSHPASMPSRPWATPRLPSTIAACMVAAPLDPPMPGLLHEAFVTVLRQRECALELARQVGVPDHPTIDWHDVDAEFPDPASKGRLFHADLALVAFDPAGAGQRGGEARAGLIFEPQLRIDPGKGTSWPIYWVSLRTRHECPVWAIVVSPVDEVIDWATRTLFHGEPQIPHVIGRNHVQPVLDLAAAQANPAWAALTAALHARGPHGRAAAETLIQACASLPAEQQRCYLRLVYAGLEKDLMNAIKPSIPEHLKVELTEYERQGGWFQNGLAEGEAKGREEGREEGRREALLVAIEARGFTLTDAQRGTIEASTDERELDRWLRRLFQADTAEALLAKS